MITLLEITGDDIASLNDADLRDLIGLLCEADFRIAGLPTKGILWGGHQDAPDGGMDVTVHSDTTPPLNSLVPRKRTVFQVKKPDMQPAKIQEEMRSKGKLKEEIRALINDRGAYIIANSTGSTTETALQRRIKAMRQAVADEPNHHQLHLDFLDRGRIATWVRTHPSLILWVRNKIERPLQGWQSYYDNWADTPTGLQEEYIVDEELKIHDGVNSEGVSAVDGLRRLRLRLSRKGASVRLTGLSGFGKTRLVQALFDERIGEQVLDPSLAHYTDISDNPIPDPLSFAHQLVAMHIRALLIVDNCSSELHRKLTKLCADSKVSLLTVEYDIRDDVPEETDVFRLESSSNDLIEKLLKLRYPHISQINTRTIAEFASGNARVAIALANTLDKDEGFSTLRDEELFDRLFHQRHNPSDDLRTSAEVCSLVYSFNGEDITARTSELKFLANLAEKSPRELYRDIAELKNRGLVQTRSIWRAVLPHAVANRLAKHALNSIPFQTIVDVFLSSGSERLIKSFTRRLGYLHDCDPAIRIAKTWLNLDGWLGSTNCDFSPFGLVVFKNIAPIAPEATLKMLERASSTDDGLEKLQNHEFIRVLRNLAYDSELFQRSTKLLSRLALLEDAKINDGSSARATLETLFHIALSGTHAPAQMRASVISALISSEIQGERNLGISLLGAALRTHGFMTSYTNTFGARPRNFGYHPNTNQELLDWYKTYLTICTRTALLETTIATKAKRVLANQIRGLWSIGVRFGQGFLEDLEHAVIQIHNQEPWNEGWISVQGIIRFDGERMDQHSLLRLNQLSRHLEPTNLLERARAYALTDRHLYFDLEDSLEEGEDIPQWKRVRRRTRQIGAAVAQDETVFRELLPELVSSYHSRLRVLGQGLADGCKDRKSMWQAMYQQIEKTPPEKRQIGVMLGFLSSCATHDPDLHQSILNVLVEDELLGVWFPYFQMTSEIDKKGIERLHKALDEGNTPIDSFKHLSFVRRHEEIGDDNLVSLLQKILKKDGGVKVVAKLLYMRFHGEKEKSAIHSQKLIAVSHDVLLRYDYEEGNASIDYELAQIASVSLYDQDGIQPARKLCHRLAEGFQEYRIHSFNYPRLLVQLAIAQPYVFLDAFICRDEYIFRRMMFGEFKRAINQIPKEVIIDWCEQAPETRYPLIVSPVQTYSSSERDLEELRWQPIFFAILSKAPDLQAVLSQLEYEFYPMVWSGSRADAMEKRLVLLAELSSHQKSEIREWAKIQFQKLQQAIQIERNHELKENQARFERFE